MAYIGQAVFYYNIIINNIYSPHRLISPRLKNILVKSPIFKEPDDPIESNREFVRLLSPK